MATNVTTDKESWQLQEQTASIYRRIINQEFVATDLEKLRDVTFEFQTVYRCFDETDLAATACSCAFQHEYLDYFDGNTISYVNTFDQICASLENGKCKHVSSAKIDDITTTSVSAFYVAIATGYRKVPVHLQNQTRSAVFRLNNFHIAILKGHYAYLEANQFMEANSITEAENQRVFDTFVFVEKDSDTPNLKVEPRMTLLRYFSNRREMDMFGKVLTHAWIGQACIDEISYFIVEDDCTALEKLLDNVSMRANSSNVSRSFTDSVAATVIRTAVLKNSTKSLEIAEDFIQKTNNFDKIDQWPFLKSGSLYIAMAIALGHDACAEILNRHASPNADASIIIPGLYVLGTILKLSGPSKKAHIFVDDVCRKSVTRRLISPDGTIFIGKGRLPLDVFGYQCTLYMSEDLKHHYICSLRSIFQSGYERTMRIAKSALVRALTGDWFVEKQTLIYLDNFLRFILFHNPDLSHILPKETIQNLAIRNDVEKYETSVYADLQKCMAYKQNANFNAFTIPMLWEYGLVFQMKDMKLDKNFNELPECVHTFLERVQDTPRSLKLQCRDTIRRHHVGLRLHGFVKAVVCPPPLKQYILMEDTLGMSDTTQCLCQAQKRFSPITC